MEAVINLFMFLHIVGAITWIGDVVIAAIINAPIACETAKHRRKEQCCPCPSLMSFLSALRQAQNSRFA